MTRDRRKSPSPESTDDQIRMLKRVAELGVERAKDVVAEAMATPRPGRSEALNRATREFEVLVRETARCMQLALRLDKDRRMREEQKAAERAAAERAAAERDRKLRAERQAKAAAEREKARAEAIAELRDRRPTVH